MVFVSFILPRKRNTLQRTTCGESARAKDIRRCSVLANQSKSLEPVWNCGTITENYEVTIVLQKFDETSAIGWSCIRNTNQPKHQKPERKGDTIKVCYFSVLDLASHHHSHPHTLTISSMCAVCINNFMRGHLHCIAVCNASLHRILSSSDPLLLLLPLDCKSSEWMNECVCFQFSMWIDKKYPVKTKLHHFKNVEDHKTSTHTLVKWTEI